MIITRTPLRISFLGGGTDYQEWFLEHGGMVLGGAIDKYSYISARYLPPFHNFKHRISYSQVELVKQGEIVSHPAVKAVMEYLSMDGAFDHEPGLEIHHASDLPGKSGTGSSSSFVVGLLHALSALQGRVLMPYQLANAAIVIEQEVLKETVGCQDQTWAAHGGLNLISFEKSGSTNIYPVPLNQDAVADLESHLLLYFTGISRHASEVSKGYVARLRTDVKFQWAMLRLAEEGYNSLLRHDWLGLGGLLDRAWQLKRELAGVTTPEIDKVYATARLSGAVGGKLLGAGGGGCLLLVVPQTKVMDVACSMKNAGMVQVPFRFEFDGSRIIFVDRNNLSARPGIFD